LLRFWLFAGRPTCHLGWQRPLRNPRGKCRTPRFKAGPPQGGLPQKNGPAAVRPRISCLDCLNSCLYWCSQKPRFPGSFLAPFLRKIRDCGGVFSTFCAFLTVSPRQMIVFRPFSRHFAGFQFSCAARSAAREARRPLCMGEKPAAGGGLKSRCFGFFGAPKSDLGGRRRIFWKYLEIHSCYSTFFTIFSYT